MAIISTKILLLNIKYGEGRGSGIALAWRPGGPRFKSRHRNIYFHEIASTQMTNGTNMRQMYNTRVESFYTDIYEKWYHFIETYNDHFKPNGWLIYITKCRRSSGLSGLQGENEERGVEGLFENKSL